MAEDTDSMPEPMEDVESGETLPADNVPEGTYVFDKPNANPIPKEPSGKPVPQEVNVSIPVDPLKELSISEQIKGDLQEAWADAAETTKEIATAAAMQYAPLIARQAAMQSSTDPIIVARAEHHLRHLKAQAIAMVGVLGLPLQQRQETRFLAAIDKVLAVAVKLA